MQYVRAVEGRKLNGGHCYPPLSNLFFLHRLFLSSFLHATFLSACHIITPSPFDYSIETNQQAVNKNVYNVTWYSKISVQRDGESRAINEVIWFSAASMLSSSLNCTRARWRLWDGYLILK